MPRMMDDKINTLHPEGKQGVCIDRAKYEQIRDAILEALAAREPMTFRELAATVERRLRGQFQGSIGWYYTTVKLDLEARDVIERIPGSRPQQLRRAQPTSA